MISRRTFLAGGLTAVVPPLPDAPHGSHRGKVSGQILDAQSRPVPGARVTLFSPDLSYFREVRSDRHGRYRFAGVPSGAFHLGASALGLEYREVIVTLSGRAVFQDFGLAADLHPGTWATGPQLSASPGSAAVVADGRVFFTRDGADALLWDPTGGTTTSVATAMGPVDHAAAQLPDGRLALLGGRDPAGTSASGAVRVLDPGSGTWTDGPSLQIPRSLPAAARLPGGQILLAGNAADPGGVSSTELVNVSAGTSTTLAVLAAAVRTTRLVRLGPAGLLNTWDAPQRLSALDGAWAAAAPFLQPKRAELETCPTGVAPAGELPHPGDLPDHDVALLPDGRLGVFGVRRTATPGVGTLLEIYDPQSDTWTAGATPLTLRSSPSVLPLPNGWVVMFGGRKEDPARPDPVDAGCRLRTTHLYAPAADGWFRMADMGSFRDGRALPVLLPDGRIAIAGGTAADDTSPSTVEVYSPPYLFRGVRPRIDRLSSNTVRGGASLDLTVSHTNGPTTVLLVPLTARSQSGQCGHQLPIPLKLSRHRQELRATLAPNVAPPGYYMLVAMVDDIPSEARIVRVDS